MPEKALTLSSSLKSIKGIGPTRLDALMRVSICCVADLLHYYPRKHLDRTTVTSIAKLKKDQDFTVIGKVEATDMRRGKRRQYFQAIISDGTGVITLTWFNGARYIQKAIKVGDRLAVSGKVEFFNGFQIVHPEYDKLKDNEDPVNSGLVIPLYSIPAELKKVRIDSRGLRRLIKTVLSSIKEIPDHFSPEYCKSNGLMGLNDALRNIHFSDSEDALKASIHRLKFDEHFFLQILMALRKSSNKKTKTKALNKLGLEAQIISNCLDFELTNAQKRVLKEIINDMARPNSMNRLLQGDVGSGKTIISILAAAIAVANNVQVAVMAPTEILAHQHFESFKKLAPHALKVLAMDLPLLHRQLIFNKVVSRPRL